MRLLFVALCAIGLAAPASAETGREICDTFSAARTDKIMLLSKKVHLFPGRIGQITEVDERQWWRLWRGEKIALALTVYCSLSAGETSVTLRGWRDGETKASIVNGNYWD